MFLRTVSKSYESDFDRLAHAPVSRLIISLGIPTTISMLITNIYNMADSYFVSQISLSAGGATSVVFGLMAIIQAFGFTFGHGAGSHVSRQLGAKSTDNASRYASVAFFSSILCGALISVLGLIFITPLMRLLGSTDTILPYAKDYALFILISAPAMTSSCVLNNVLRYEGKARLAMIGLTSGGILNIILDPVFIFGLNMGAMGAGLATAVSQCVSFGILLSIFLLGKTQSRLSLRLISKIPATLADVIVTGLPSLARQGLSSVSTMVLNFSAKPFGDAAIASMGYVGRTSHLIFSVGLGIGQGFQPVSGFNYGAKRYSRVKKGTLFTLGFGTGFIALVSSVCFALAPQIISIFRKEAEVVELGSLALRVQCVFLLFLPASVVATMLFQSIGKSGRAFTLSCLQSGGIFIILCLILPRFFDVYGIVISQPLAYLASALVSLPMMILFLKKLPPDEVTDNDD